MQKEYHEIYAFLKESYDGPLSMYKFMNLSEAERVTAAKKIVDQMYVLIAERYNTIDFGDIPKSYGKIKDMKQYKNLTQSITLLENIAKTSRQSIPEIAVLREALTNLENLEEKFHYGFVKQIPTIIMTYNILAMAVYCGTSLMISVLVDYINTINDPNRNDESVQLVIDKKFKRQHPYLMIHSLEQFNTQVKNGSFARTIEHFIADSRRPTAMTEAVSASIVTVLAILGVIKLIPMIKELIYLFFFSRMKLSDALEIQAELVKGNMETLKYKGIDENNKTYKVQKWIADKLVKLSNFFSFSYEKGEKKAEIESKQKLTADDIVLF